MDLENEVNTTPESTEDGTETGADPTTGAAAGTGANEQGAADPAAEAGESGAETGAGDDAGNGTESAQPTGENEQGAADPAGNAQTREENARFAAVRRQERIAADKRARAEIDAFYQKMYSGKTNPETGLPVLTKADAEAFETAARNQQVKKNLLEMGMDDSLADALSGAVAKAGEFERQQKQQAEIARMQQEEEVRQATRQTLDRQMAALKREYPNCGYNSIEDAAKDPKMAPFLAQMVSLDEKNLVYAYRNAHWDDISASTHAAARQEAINAARGTQHLQGLSGGGSAPAMQPIPAGVLGMWKETFPDDTQEQLTARYNKTIFEH